MNHLSIFGKLKEVPIVIKDVHGKRTTQVVVEAYRNFRNVDGQYDADTFVCFLWRELSETMLENLKVGDTVGVSGRLESSALVNEFGATEYQYMIFADDVKFG